MTDLWSTFIIRNLRHTDWRTRRSCWRAQSLPAPLARKGQAGAIRNGQGIAGLAIRNPQSAIRNGQGQALIELSIFGVVMIVVLGALVSYGLHYDYQQSALMEAFRRALGLTSSAPTGSVILIRDRHIANPSDAFMVGAAIPITGSASITRDSKLHYTPNTTGELPAVTIDINGHAETFKTAGFGGGGLDACEGELLDESRCKAQCLEDSSPWYCSKLDQLFAGIRDMGVQPEIVRQTNLKGTLTRNEQSSNVQTQTSLDHQEQLTRRIVFRPLGDTSGNTSTSTVTTTPVHEKQATTWTTDW